ncbi:MAG: hypothetical protein NTW85_06450 [Methylococcales bacterium]|nr:hypothetical protein [Methylococcales bacterium]
MSIADLYEELNDTNLALKAVEELCGSANERISVNMNNLAFLLKLIAERNDTLIAQLDCDFVCRNVRN